MPSKKNAINNDYTTSLDADLSPDLLDPEPAPRSSRKKNKNAKQTRIESTERSSEPELAREASATPPPVPPIPRAFPDRTHPDALEELTRSEKVSDDQPPTQDTQLPPSNDYSRSPPPDLLPGFSHHPSPPGQNYVVGGGFSTRSPPISPPQTKARPVSYGGPPSTVGYTRNSPSPYAYPSSAFGSPPPHMPQAHFFNAQDIDLGLGRAPSRNQPANFVKFLNISGQKDSRPALVLGASNRLDVLDYHGDKFTWLATLNNLPGTVHDAAVLTWSHGEDPFKAMRPLIALTIHGLQTHNVPDQQPLSETSRRASILTQRPDWAPTASTSVIVCSLRQQTVMSTLLHVPSLQGHQIPAWMDLHAGESSAGRLKLQASGNHLLVSSGISGEIYIFGTRLVDKTARFICLEKLWTSLQPRIRRRDSSHTRPGDAGISPADISRAKDDQEQPIAHLSGRWLAFCPVLASRPSLGALLGENVLCSNSVSITSRSGPARPAANCAVDSPDVETILGRVAKGVAQEVLKGGKWLGEKGVQAWQSYWSQDNPSKASPGPSPVYSPQQHPSFPPTHGEAAERASREPEIVSIVDLTTLESKETRKHGLAPMATFQPPGGCSFLSFSPNGLTLMTASRRGDIYYVWDLLQTRYPRISLADEGEQRSTKVRQIAKNERFSESVIVDMQWEAPLGHRYAVLTQNSTVHMFDMPATAFRWPPLRARRKKRPVSVPADTANTGTQQTSGFFSSAMSFANSRAQPMLANLRGRTPNMGGGVTGIGSTGLGYASATGMRGGKVVAAGFSKSLGAATDTVASIRHAGQSKLHLKSDAVAGRLSWTYRDQRSRLSILETTEVKSYYVRKTNPRDRRPETVSVFDSRKVVNAKIPTDIGFDSALESNASARVWRPDPLRRPSKPGVTAPLSFAEIDSNFPYQPFHSDHRVTISVYSSDTAATLPESQYPTASALLSTRPESTRPSQTKKAIPAEDKWLFGNDIPTIRLNTGSPQRDDDAEENNGDGSHPAGYRSVVYRETTLQPAEAEGEMEKIVSTTRRRKGKKHRQNGNNDVYADDFAEGDGFFEDDCDILDFAEDRV